MDIHALFYQDPYMKEFDAEVISCEKGKKGYEIVLSRTAFYPEGGGQPADHGKLNDAAVFDVHERDGKILHYTDKEIPAGTSVHGVIDWERRFDFMQNHSGEHIFSGLVHKKFGYDNVGFHMNEDTVFIDFNGPMTLEEALDIEEKANELIWENKECRIFYPSEEELSKMEFRSKKELTGTVRIVEFPKGDLCACCGTHVARSGEIGLIKVLPLVNHRGGVRLELRAGKRALQDYRKLTESNQAIGHLLSAKPYETKEAVDRILDDEAALKERIAKINQKYYQVRAQSVEKKEGVVIFREDDMNPYEIRKFCEYLIEAAGFSEAAVLSVKDGSSWNYVIGSKENDLRPRLKEWNAHLSGRGGGKPNMVQGSFAAAFEEIEKTLAGA